MATAAVQLPTAVHNVGASQLSPAAPITATAPDGVVKHDVDTELNFFLPNADGTPPAPTIRGRPETFDRPADTHKVTIKDVSGDEAKYTLDGHGFQYARHVSAEKAFVDDEQIKNVYYKEVDQLLKDVTGATRTFIFDHTIRRPNSSTADAGLRGPVLRVHVDQSYAAALSRVPHHLPEEAERLLKGRVQLINVWRPIKTVLRDPLSVAQASTVEEQDLVKIGLIYEDRNGETLSVKHNPKHQFYYKHHQTPEEVLFIKCFDNRAGVESDPKYKDRAKRVPHSAFVVPGTENEEARESIEVRCLVFHENDLE